jgi:hypothetical protein
MAGLSPAMTDEGGSPSELSAGLIERRSLRATRLALLEVERRDDLGDFLFR